MKQIIIIALLFAGMQLVAQPKLTGAWFPAAGSSFVMTEADTIGFTALPHTDTSTIWDYSGLQLRASTNTITYLDTTGYSGLPLGVNLIYKDMTGTTELMKNYDTIRELWNNHPFIIYQFPLTYGSSFSDNASDASLPYLITGITRSVSANSWGTLILPGHDTIYNTLRLVITSNNTSDYSGPPASNSSHNHLVSYQWLSAAISNPLLQMDFTQNGGYDGVANLNWTSSSERIFVLSSYHQVAGLREEGYNPMVSIYPNPAQDYVFVSLPVGLGALDIKVYDTNGKLVISQRSDNSRSNLFIAALAAGVYIVEIDTPKGKCHKLLVKQ